VHKQVEKIEKILASKNLEIMFARIAANLLKRDNLEEAIQICEHGLKKFSTYAQGHYVLAKCYLRKGLTTEAKAEFERVLKFDLMHINSIKALAEIYKTAGLKNYYRDYLLKLFIIDPLNEDIVAEVKKIDQYDNWVLVDNSNLKAAEQKNRPVPDQTPSPEIEPTQLDETTEQGSRRQLDDIYYRDKVDLSQFNNIRDDFTTILQGQPVPTKQGDQQTPAPVPPAANEKTEWAEDLTYTYSDDTLLDDRKINRETESGEEEIKTAVQDLSFDEETEKIIEKEGLKEKTDKSSQIRLNFPTDTEVKNISEAESTIPLRAQDMPPPAGDASGSVKREDRSAVTGREFPLSGDEDEDNLPFTPPKIISQTLGEILVSQKKYSEALEVFKTLRQKNPANKNFDKKIEFLQKIIALEKGSQT
jgi:tetratricopeptide (TPR) repeat protein